MVQTGPKIQLGGLKKGLLRVEYQVGIDEAVKKDPIPPAESEINKAKVNFGRFSVISGSFFVLLTYEFWRCFLIDVRTFFDEKQFPFYRLDNVGDYTFSKYKVLWKEQSKQMTATVVSSLNDKYLGDKTVVTDSKVLYVSFDNKEEANYLCAVLNSRLIGKIIEAYTIDVQKGVDIVKNINIPKYNSKNKLHLELAELSIEAHEKYKTNNLKELLGIEERIENIVPKIFE